MFFAWSRFFMEEELMDIKQVRCTTCGASLEIIGRPSTHRCDYCQNQMVISHAIQLASLDKEVIDDIANVRENLQQAIHHNNIDDILTSAQTLRSWLPDDLEAGYFFAYAKATRNQPDYMASFLKTKPEATEETLEKITQHLIQRSDLRDKDLIDTYLKEYYPNDLDKYLKVYDQRYHQEDQYAAIPRDVFICHSSKQKDLAEKLVEVVEDEGHYAWISSRNLRPQDSDNYWKNIEDAIKLSKVVLVVSSKEAMISKDVQKEIELAKKHEKTLIEYKIDDTPHTMFFKHTFDGIKWIEGDLFLKNINYLKQRFFEKINQTPEKINIPPKKLTKKFFIIAASFIFILFASLLGIFGAELRETLFPSPSIPVITGVNDITIYANEAFDPLVGISASDVTDGNLTANLEIIGQQAFTQPGTYRLTYVVTNSQGQTTEIEREIRVHPPSIPELRGINDLSILQGDAFNPLSGITAIDPKDGNLTAQIQVIGTVNTLIPGSYRIIYVITNSIGETVEVERKVDVTESLIQVPEIVIYFGISELRSSIENFASEWSKENDINVRVDFCGGDNCYYQAGLDELLESGSFIDGVTPDIFSIMGQSHFEKTRPHLMPISNQNWINLTDFARRYQNQVYGLPLNLEGYGMIYNKNILEAAGINPDSLNSLEGYRAAFEKLESMKEELGITDVVSMAAGAGMEWVTGLHNFNGYLSAGLQFNDTSIIDALNAGELDISRLQQLADWVELLFQYSNQTILLEGTYNSQIQVFKNETVAFIHQGSWIDRILMEGPAIDFPVGIAPHASMSGNHESIFALSASHLGVNINSPNQDLALKFLSDLATAEGQAIMNESNIFITPFKDNNITPNYPVSQAIHDYILRGNIYNGSFPDMMTSISAMDDLGSIYFQFARGNITKAQFITRIVNEIKTTSISYDIALITDGNRIDDESFNQGTWEGIVAWAEANDKTYQYYRPSEVSNAAYLESIELAINLGAQIVIMPGFLFSPVAGAAQMVYPDVKFVLLDAVPAGGVGDNTVSILFAEHESGFLAGYAAVRNGARRLGFMGGIAVPAVVRFGVGFVAGAYYAADELGVNISFPANRYAYLGTFGPSDEVRTRALAWYQDGTDIIFAAAGGAGSSVMSAAEAANRPMIGVDVDQSYLSSSVLTSAMKDLGSAVAIALDGFYSDNFPGGETLTLGASNNGVALPTDLSRFTDFTTVDYNTLYELVATGQIDVPASHAELVAFLNAKGISGLQIGASDIQP